MNDDEELRIAFDQQTTRTLIRCVALVLVLLIGGGIAVGVIGRLNEQKECTPCR